MEETSTTSNRQRFKSVERKKKKKMPAGRGCNTRKRNSWVKIANTKNDGYAWWNNGLKKIANAKFPRTYYRCAHKDKGCGARRHVQKLEDGSEMFRITYIGSHTCQNMNENTRMLTDAESPPERSLFGSETEKKRLSEGGKRQQPGSSSKIRKLVKAGSNVVVNISSESHESLEIDHDAVQSSRDTDPHTGNVVLEKRPARRRGKKIVFSESSESSDRDTGPHLGNIVLEAPLSAGKRRCPKEISFSESDESDLHVLDQVKCLPELVTSWYERKAKREACLRDQIARFRLRMTHQAAKNAKLVNMVRKLKKVGTLGKGQEAIRIPAKNDIEHVKVVEALQKELENARAQTQSVEHAYEKLKQELELEKEGRRQERVSLEKSLKQVSSERQWLIQEGFEYVINRLHRSQEYLGLLGAVQSNLWDSGAHYGLVQSYESCKDDVPLEDASLYNPEAHGKFLNAVHELEHTRFPYIAALSQSADRSLDDLRALEPKGLEKDGDEVSVAGDGNDGDE
ncbi:hypothetical protein M8C21_006536 [Ambrosia artemisiifolia]|uniref:WRKY domain-containing protein n=1 Tax=Ambrosia artemisiifolia TaxID=4212 RepID=A0AAD5D8A9_AMBAR|nr:hypothetical protein M8C21_006536 [Ambrosia artemisiifolia]